MSHRENNGRFKKGNPGGPGRPARMVETDYLASLSEQVPRDAWASIVSNAVESAVKGDPKAREWLSRYLLPNDKGNHLSKIAELETQGGDGADNDAPRDTHDLDAK